MRQNAQLHEVVIMTEASDIDVSQRTVILRDGSLTYDILIIVTGASHQYFGHHEWVQTAPGLKTITVVVCAYLLFDWLR